MRFQLGIAGTRCFLGCFKLSFLKQTQVLTVELISGETDQLKAKMWQLLPQEWLLLQCTADCILHKLRLRVLQSVRLNVELFVEP